MVRPLLSAVLLASFTLLPACNALPKGYGGAQPLHVSRQLGTSNMTSAERANAVKDAFQFAWDGYYTYAFPHDDLLPVSDGFSDPRNGWGASAVDALSTATIMGLGPVVDVILDHIATIDYGYTNTTCSLFETTIRYLGGMLAGYDLLTGPFEGLASNQTKVDILLSQSVNLANVLKFAFNTSTGIPVNDLWITNQTQEDDTTNSIAGFGTLVLEWTHLSDLINDTEYASLSQRAEEYLLNPQPATAEPFPGLLGTNVEIDTGLFTDQSGGWVGSDDSFYEYLIKMYIYDSSRFEHYKDRWVTAVESSMQYLASRPASRPDLLFLAEFDGTQTVNTSEHLACFDGGNFILGGTVLGRQDIVDFGLELVAGCHDTYISTETGIGPEIFSWNTTGLDENNTEFYNEHGFYITDPVYITRPEVIESYYYAYRVTGNTTYQDWAWDAFVAINASCRTNSGFSSISDVNAPDGGTKTDDQESFLFAEVMKYSYIIHAEDGPWQVENDGTNMFVFNTEAHPMRVAGTPI